jgi:hypothetical protein
MYKSPKRFKILLVNDLINSTLFQLEGKVTLKTEVELISTIHIIICFYIIPYDDGIFV